MRDEVITKSYIQIAQPKYTNWFNFYNMMSFHVSDGKDRLTFVSMILTFVTMIWFYALTT